MTRTDRSDFADFVRAEQSGLVRFAMVVCGNREDAQDLTATALTRAYERWPTIAALEHPTAYLRRMITNDFLSGRRRHSRFQRLMPRLVRVDAEQPDTAEVVDPRSALVAALNKLPPMQRTAVVLRYYADLPDAEIAEWLGCRPVTVRSHLSRALARLRVDEPELRGTRSE